MKPTRKGLGCAQDLLPTLLQFQHLHFQVRQEDHSRYGRLFHCVRRQMVLVLDSGQTHAQEQTGICVIKQRSKKRSRETVPAS